MKLIIFGDVVGKLGREGVKRMLPLWQEKLSPDVVIANVENIAHGKGIGVSQLDELKLAGVNIFTGGNHSFTGKNAAQILNDETVPIVRPANAAEGLPGRGVLIYSLSSGKTESETDDKLLVINLIGQVGMRQNYDSPFHEIDRILEKFGNETPYKIVDWHAEATSEKEVMGWYLDGKVSAVVGTHTHVPTADARVLPKGTGYISDIGMVGPHDSIIGVEIEPAFKRFKEQLPSPMEVAEEGPIEVNAVFLELDGAGRTLKIEHLRQVVSS
ncbi:YmdB family metallophosphoesterase [Candidatus Giovannonibacteria bacterium]|nr:YmdB family metallophosphoesterase [Candidatus Giovannonibacteria bacterium]